MLGRTIAAMIAASFVLVGLHAPAKAELMTYDIGWTGTDDYTMTGAFSFDRSL